MPYHAQDHRPGDPIYGQSCGCSILIRDVLRLPVWMAMQRSATHRPRPPGPGDAMAVLPCRSGLADRKRACPDPLVNRPWQQFLRRPRAAWLTHGSLVAMTATYFAVVARAPFWIAFVPGVLLAHRIGVMLHEYIHGIPFRRYRDCLAVVTFFDGFLLLFGLLELFRGTHLSHHRWLNQAGDSGFRQARTPPTGNRWLALVTQSEISQHLGFFWESFRGLHPFVQRRRVILGAIGSLAFAGAWIAIGRPDMVWKILLISIFTTAVPVSLRGAIEHHSHRGDHGFANDYKTVIPLFNLNRHIHHHEDPRCPWYLLEFRQKPPLPARHYFTHWFGVYWRRELVLMQPQRRAGVHREGADAATPKPVGLEHRPGSQET